MEDLFEAEQNILIHASNYLESISDSEACSRREFEIMVEEYRKLLKQLRRITRMSDRTVEELNISKLNLIERVYKDELTGIYNRRYIEETLRDYKGALSVVMLDVDFFKRYNDTYGHSSGDECLKAVAKSMCCAALNSLDFAARYGGEEFLVVLPGAGSERACTVTEEILESVLGRRISHEKNDASEWVTISAGIATGVVNFDYSAEDFIKRADIALYHSKQTGRNKYTLWNAEISY